MELLANERIILFGLLPETGDITTMKGLRILKEEIVLNSDDIEAIEFITEVKDGKLISKWDPDKAKEVIKDVDISGVMLAMIVDILKKKESDKELTDNHIELWDKFCE